MKDHEPDPDPISQCADAVLSQLENHKLKVRVGQFPESLQAWRPELKALSDAVRKWRPHRTDFVNRLRGRQIKRSGRCDEATREAAIDTFTAMAREQFKAELTHRGMPADSAEQAKRNIDVVEDRA